MRTMIWIASSLLFVLTSCGSSESPTQEETSKASKVEVKTIESASEQTTTISPKYKNGINDQNRGDKLATFVFTVQYLPHLDLNYTYIKQKLEIRLLLTAR